MEKDITSQTANMLVYGADGSEMVFPVNAADLNIGDLIVVEEGEITPADFKILVGEITIEKDASEISFSKGDIALANYQVKKGKAKGYVFAKWDDNLLA